MTPSQSEQFSAEPVPVAYFLAASRDRNPIHVSETAAAQAGLPGVIIPGPYGLGMVYLACVERYGVHRIEHIQGRFRAPLLVGNPITLDTSYFDGSKNIPVSSTDRLDWTLSHLETAPAVSGSVVLTRGKV